MSSIELVAKLKAIDEMSDKMKKIGDTTEKAMKQTSKSVEQAEFSMKKFTASISGVMTAGFALYNAYDRIQDKQLAVEKAQNALISAQISAKQAQEAYNKAVEKYGADSEEARLALEKLELAQEKVRTANEELKNKQDEVNNAIIQLAIQSVPTAITAISNLRGAMEQLKAAIASAEGALASFGVTAGGLVASITAVGASLLYVYWRFDELSKITDITIGEFLEFGGVLSLVQWMGGDVQKALDALREAVNRLGEAFASVGSQIKDFIKNTSGGILKLVDAFEEAEDEIITGSIWPEMWEEIINVTKKGMKENLSVIDRALDRAERMLARPFYMNFAINIDVMGLRGQIEKIVADALKSVVIEKTTAQATTSRIRVPTTTTVTPTRRTPIMRPI